MSYSTLTGTFGVSLLLLAFYLNITGKVKSTDKIYLLMNFFGASISCYASWLINYIPFVALEGVWALVSAHRIYKLIAK
jgi:hypothetical protein